MEIRQSLETNFLTCKMCARPYQQPKVLECLHSFCLGCLDENVRKQKEDEEKERSTSSYSSGYYSSRSSSKWSRSYYSSYGNNDYSYNKQYNITCVICEKKTLVPKGGCVSLPDDLLSGKLASLVGKLPTYPICDVCTPDGLLPGSNLSAITEISGQIGRSGGEGASSCSDAESENDSLMSTRATESDTNDSNGLSYRYRRNKNRNQDKLNGTRNSVDLNGYEKNETEPKRAQSACLDCGKRLCELCQMTHSSMPVTAEHILIRVDQLDQMKCDKHPRELRRFYCLTCESCICLVCTFDTMDPRSAENGHTDHNVLSMRQAVDSYQHIIDDSTNEAQIHVEKIERLLDGMRICERHVVSMCKAIDDAAEKRIAKIRETQTKLKDSISSNLNLKSMSISDKCNEFTRAIDNWYKLTKDETFSERLDLMNPIEALDAALPLIDKIKDCLVEIEKEAEPKNDNLRDFYCKFDSTPKSTIIIAERDNSSEIGSCSPATTTRKTSLKKKHVTFKLDYEEPPNIDYWIEELGNFESGKEVELGRIVTPHQSYLERLAEEEKYQDKNVQVDRVVEYKHRCVQINYFEANQADVMMQTDAPTLAIATRVDNGTQYLSSDVNSPISFFRGGKQIIVQK